MNPNMWQREIEANAVRDRARAWFSSPEGRRRVNLAIATTLEHIVQIDQSRRLSLEELHAPFTL